MSAKSRSEQVARSEIRFAFAQFKEAQELREQAREMAKRIAAALDGARSSLQVVQELRWGKDLIKAEVGEANIYLPDLLRLFDGDARE